jgi:hypothetical protein
VKLNIEVECTPQEARAFIGLPDVAVLNDHIVREMKNRIDANMAMVAPEELIKSWMTFGGQATEQFRRLLTAAATGAAGSKS